MTIDAGESFLLDDLRVGTDWASVTSAVPEPSSAALLAAGAASCFVALRRRRRA